jgi:SM-20-related protein
VTQAREPEELATRIAAAIADRGWYVADFALPEPLAAALTMECYVKQDAFKPAGTGRGQDHHRDESVRSDTIRWLDQKVAADENYLELMDHLRVELNSRLYLGLFDYECHYARYAPGAWYRKHVDAFAGEKNRVLSTVFYLNTDWRKEEGGELLLYGPDGEQLVASVTPQYNRLVVFQSERFPHEVKPATRARHSVAGWFRIRA